MRACTHNKAVACSHPVLPAPKSIHARARVQTYLRAVVESSDKQGRAVLRRGQRQRLQSRLYAQACILLLI